MRNEGVNNNINNPITDFEELQDLQELAIKNKEDEKTMLELENRIKKSPMLTLTNHIQGEVSKVRKYCIIQQKRCTNDFLKINSELNSLLVEKAKLDCEIETFQKELMKIKSEKKCRQEKFEEVESALKLKQNALRIAKNMFECKFNMDIEIEDKTPETFVAVVYFGKDIKEPVKFIINHVQRKIIDFDASSVLSSTEEEELKKKFKGYDSIQALTCALRSKFLKN